MPKPLYSPSDHFLLPGDRRVDVVRSRDDDQFLGVGASSLEEVVGMGNRDGFILFRVDDQRRALVARL